MSMVNFRHIAVCLAAVFVLTPLAFAQQEALVGIQRPQRYRATTAAPSPLLKNQPTSAAPLDTLDLPFFDDFSLKTAGAPNPRRWLDSYVFVNNTYPVNPPTMGVATFDILDEAGRVYGHAGSTPFAADTLTSMPIRLDAADAGVYLSFAYQPKGNGDMPERRDSLTLQFFSPLDSSWVHMWGVIVDADTLKEAPYVLPSPKRLHSDSLSRRFFRAMLPVSDPRFLRPGFQFRFINYATRARDEVQGREGNCDMWHVDVVYLNKNRTESDTTMVDVAIQRPIMRLLREYTCMPWTHLKSSATAQREQLGASVTVSPRIANLYAYENAFTTTITLSCVQGAAGTVAADVRHFPSINIQPSATRTFDFNLPASYVLNTPQADADSVAFDVQLLLRNYIVSPPLRREYAANDTCVFRQRFYPCYAYDDGTAENGYGISGEQAARAKVAVKFKVYRRDTLSGVFLYFNSAADSGNMQPFKLAVWGDKGGVPGEELYVEPDCYPRFDSLNSYVYYPLAKPIPVQDSFYVGWVQQSAAFLNVGFDVNSSVRGKSYVSLNGYTWTPSDVDGQGIIMVRPSFAKQRVDLPTSVVPKATLAHSIIVYPNPVRDELRLDLPDALREKALRMEVFDRSGTVVMQREVAAGSSVSVAQLAAGSYFVRFSCSGSVAGFARFIKM